MAGSSDYLRERPCLSFCVTKRAGYHHAVRREKLTVKRFQIQACIDIKLMPKIFVGFRPQSGMHGAFLDALASLGSMLESQ